MLRDTCFLGALGAALALVACSGDGGPPFVPAPHPALPQVVDRGGPVLAKPRVQPIAYAGDDGLAYVEGFLTDLGKTSYWSDVTSEYGVGPLTILPTITIGTPPPATLDDTPCRR